MRHSHTKIWIHLVWATKNRERLLFREEGKILYDFIIKKAIEINVPFERLNIQPEHIHGLIDLPANFCVSDFMKSMKGSSSKYMNDKKIIKQHFAWQRGYGAYSVSGSKIDIVKKYIENQDKHHRRKSFTDEYEDWKKEYGIFDD